MSQTIPPLCLDLADTAATEALGAALALSLPDDATIYLHGPLGAGKTTLVRGLLRALGHDGTVKSPTYTLVEDYQVGGRALFHFDLYRLAEPQELDYIGISDYFGQTAIRLIEWPEQGQGVLPLAELDVELAYQGTARCASIAAPREAGRQVLQELAQAWLAGRTEPGR